jgi:hypothetical protein
LAGGKLTAAFGNRRALLMTTSIWSVKSESSQWRPKVGFVDKTQEVDEVQDQLLKAGADLVLIPMEEVKEEAKVAQVEVKESLFVKIKRQSVGFEGAFHSAFATGNEALRVAVCPLDPILFSPSRLFHLARFQSVVRKNQSC